METLGRRIDEGDTLLSRAARRDLGALDVRALIAVQAGVYRYVEAVDFAAKLVDRVSGAVRSVLQASH